MNVHYPSLLFAALLSLGSTAQTLDQSNFAAQPGMTFSFNRSAYVAPGPAGAGQNWNFSGLSTEDAGTISWVSPASTGQSGSFSGATVASGESDMYVFYSINSNGWDMLGFYSPEVGAMPYQDPERMFAFPLSYNSSWTDNYSASYSYMGIPVTVTGSISGQADAYGTLVMPYGTVTNVLRVRTVDTGSEEMMGFGTEHTFTAYHFIKPGVHSPILTVGQDSWVVLGQTDTDEYVNWLADGTVGVEEALRNSIGVDVFANPAAEQTVVTFSSTGGTLTLEVLDQTGRMVRTALLTGQPLGIGQHTIDVSGMPAGMYMLRITDANGEQGTKRLVVE